MSDAPTVVFSAQAVLALPYLVSDCTGARVKGNRDPEGQAQVLCRFHPGELIQPAPAFGLDIGAALVLSPADARALARSLERAAEEAEEQ